MVQHEGGQHMSVPHNINNNFNGSAGLSVGRQWHQGPWTVLSCRAMWYHQHGNAAIPFADGWGLYPELLFAASHWSLSASYWYGNNFVPLMGSWHFSNLSANMAGLVFDHTRVVTLSSSWTWNPHSSDSRFRLYGVLYHYMPSVGTFADGTTRDYGHRNQFSVGASLSFFPSVKLR